MRPEQKLVLVTGAGSGIGRALCVEAANRGMAVALCGRRQEALEATRTLLGNGAGHLIIPTHIKRPEDHSVIVDRIRNGRGALEMVRIIRPGSAEWPVWTFDDDALARTFQT